MLYLERPNMLIMNSNHDKNCLKRVDYIIFYFDIPLKEVINKGKIQSQKRFNENQISFN